MVGRDEDDDGEVEEDEEDEANEALGGDAGAGGQRVWQVQEAGEDGVEDDDEGFACLVGGSSQFSFLCEFPFCNPPLFPVDHVRSLTSVVHLHTTVSLRVSMRRRSFLTCVP